tara:strand:+ start:27724 stop:30801 length:3078 start_codon:yes stop_codon:yes gene_type:complete
MADISSALFDNRVLPVVLLQKGIIRNVDASKISLNMQVLLKAPKVANKKWYDNKSIRNRLRVCICLVYSRRLTKQLLNNEHQMRALIRSARSAPGVKRIYASLDQLEKNSEITNSEAINLAASKSVDNVRLAVRTEIDKRFISKNGYVSCLITPYLAEEGLLTVTGLSEEKGTLMFPMGDTIIENILQNNNSPRTSMVFTLKETISGYGNAGEVWAGPIHYHKSRGYMAGYRHNPNMPHPTLNAEQVACKKIIDLRQQKEFIAQLKKAESEIDKLTKQYKTESNVFESALSKHKSYFSPITYGRAADNSVNFHFAIDVGNIAKKSAKYSYMYSNKTDLAAAIKIYDVTVWRKRVLQHPVPNALTGIPEFRDEQYANEMEDYVCKLSDGTLQILNTPNLPSYIYNFIGLDKEIADFNAGLYQYKVYVTFMDESVKKISMASKTLDLAAGAYSKYVRAAANTRGFNFSTNTFDTSVVEYLYNSFTDWKNVVSTYLGTIAELFGEEAFRGVSIENLQRNLLSMTDPRSATLGTMREVEGLVQRLSNRLERELNINASIGRSGPAYKRSHHTRTQDGSRDGKSPTPSILRHEFSLAYETQTRNFGLDYISGMSSPENTGLPAVSFAQWNARISSEASYYNNASKNNTTVNSNGYLSPQEVITPDITIPREQATFEAGLPLLRNRLASRIPGNAMASNYDQRNETIRLDLLSLANVSVTPLRKPIGEVLEEKTSCLSLLDSKEIFGKDSKFVFEDRSSLAGCTNPGTGSVVGNDEIKIIGRTDREEQILNVELVDNIINELSTGFKQEAISVPENIAGSLAASDLANNTNISVTADTFDFNIRYNSSMIIEYLSGYASGDNGIQVNAEVWNQLNNNIMRQSQNSNTPLICRMRTTTNVVNIDNPYELAAYNELFIIGVPSYTLLAPPPPPSTYIAALDSRMSDASINKGMINLPIEYTLSEENILNSSTSTSAMATSPVQRSSRPNGSPRMAASNTGNGSRQRGATRVSTRRTTGRGRSGGSGGSGGGGY